VQVVVVACLIDIIGMWIVLEIDHYETIIKSSSAGVASTSLFCNRCSMLSRVKTAKHADAVLWQLSMMFSSLRCHEMLMVFCRIISTNTGHFIAVVERSLLASWSMAEYCCLSTQDRCYNSSQTISTAVYSRTVSISSRTIS
jgi:hypothetical protein